MSMRTMWHGTISFGLVSVPVGLAKAQDRQGVSFRQVHRGCGERVRQPKVCPLHGELTMDDVTQGYELPDGTIFEVPDGALESAQPNASKIIEVKGFVPITDVDPILRDRTYYLLPAKEKNAREGYVLLVDAMAKAGRAALASFVLWSRENLCTVRSDGDRLLLDMLYYAEDIRDPAPVDLMLDDVKTSKATLDLAVQLIEKESMVFDHATYFSEYRTKLGETLDSLIAGKAPKKSKTTSKPKKDDDLFAALKASVEGASKKPATRSKKVAERSVA